MILRNSNFLVWLCILTLFSNIANSKQKKQKIKLSTAGKIHVPKSIEDISLIKTNKFSQKELGVAFTYQANETPIKLTYYIYPVSEKISLEFAMISEYNMIIKEMKHVAERQGGIFSLLLEEVISVDNQQVIHVLANMEDNKSSYISELFFTSNRNHFIKLRVTHPMHASKDFKFRQTSRSFFEELLKQTVFKSKDKPEIVINVDPESFSGEEDINMKEAIMYGIAVRHLLPKDLIIDYKLYLHIYKKTLEATRGVAKLKNEKIQSKPGELTIFDVESAGFLKELIWSVFKRPYWQEPKDLNMQAFEKWAKENEPKKIIVRPISVGVLVEH